MWRRNNAIMRASKFRTSSIVDLLQDNKIATMPELMGALGTSAKRTVFRKLEELDYRSSYSHRGSYYTLSEVAEFDEQGLWSWRNVGFSTYGTLLSTAAAKVETGELGYYVDELDNLLHVGTKDALRKLAKVGRVARERVGGRLLYCASDAARRRQQLVGRHALLAEPGAAGPLPETDLLPEELRAAIVLFFSLLDEKQRRLYAGLESLKSGHGGDTQIAALLGLHKGTVSRGRHQLLQQDVEVERVRMAGAGRNLVEKKRRK